MAVGGILCLGLSVPSLLGAQENVEGLKTGVVKITAQVEGRTKVGTGFVVRLEDDAAYILTASHVIEGDPSPQVTFFTKPNRSMPARILGMDSLNPKGLATLLVEGEIPSGTTPLSLGPELTVLAGTSVTLIGFPRVPPVPWAVTQGTLTGQTGQDLIISGSANEGNSGGPILKDGKVVAVVTEVAGDFVYGVPVVIAQVALKGWGVKASPDVPTSIATLDPEPSIKGIEKTTPSEESKITGDLQAQPKTQTPAEESAPPDVQEKPESTIEETRVRPLHIPSQQEPQTIPPEEESSMVLIPSGKFWMGSAPGEECEWDAVFRVEFCLPVKNADYAPRHRVEVEAFYLDANVVTNQEFRKFVNDTAYQGTTKTRGSKSALVKSSSLLFGIKWERESLDQANWQQPYGPDSQLSSDQATHPVVQVSWFDAQAFCRWDGKRLPTEAEWEYAARAGTESKHWWGEKAPGAGRVGNLPDARFLTAYGGDPTFKEYDDGYARTSPTGSYDANALGIYDMSGNVWEWTADWYGATYYKNSPGRNPPGPAAGDKKVKRGGSWYSYSELVSRGNQAPEDSDDETGFRCAKDAK